MPQAQIRINAVPGTNDDLPINTLVQLDNTNTGGELSYLWTILDQPPGTADVLSNPAIQNPTFTPKKEGSYLIKLVVNFGNPVTERTDIRVAAIRDLKSRERIPAAGEKLEQDAVRGWATRVGALLSTLINKASDPGIVIGVAGVGGLTRGTVLVITGTSTIKVGLPGQEKLPTYTKYSSDPTNSLGLVGILETGVDGSTTPANGALIRVRVFGRMQGLTGVPIVGALVYANQLGAIVLTEPAVPSRLFRPLGQVLAIGGGLYDIWVNANTPPSFGMDVAEHPSALVSPADMFRLACIGGIAKISTNEAAFAEVITTLNLVTNLAGLLPSGNKVYVDKIFGNDGTGARQGKAFLTITAALAVAVSGDTVVVGPGVYNESITIPAGVVVRGISAGVCTIQKLLVTVDTDLVTMSNSSRLEDVSLILTSAQHRILRGIVFPGTTTATARVRNIVLVVDNSTAGAGTSNVTGIHSIGTGAPTSEQDTVRASAITILSANLGNKRCILHDTAAGVFRCRDVAMRVVRTGAGGSYIGIEVNQAGSTISIHSSSVQGEDADISQTAGSLLIGTALLLTPSANGLGFTPTLKPYAMEWGVPNPSAGVTRFLYSGTEPNSTNEVFGRVGVACIARSITVRARIGPGAARTDTWTLRKNGVNTGLTVSLVAAATFVSLTTVSVSFLPTDDISLQQVTAGGTTTADVQVSVEFY